VTPALPFSPLVNKELRALLPVWLACAAALAPGHLGSGTELMLPGIVAYLIGSTTLGALSIGHEYSYRTLDQLLSLPGHRHRLLRTKLAVLVSLLAALGAVAWVPLVRIAGEGGSFGTGSGVWVWTIVLLSFFSAVCIAPWFTMLCRNPIAGVVFTIAIPATLWVVNVEQGIGLPVLWGGTVAVSAVAAIFGWRFFTRLEVIGGDSALEMPHSVLRRLIPSESTSHMATARPRHPLPLLVRKELRLQSVTFVVVALYVLMWAVMSVAGARSYVAGSVFVGVTILYCGLTAMLVGSLASAEERGFGTIECQVLQPYAVWKQWTIKVAIALTLTALFTLALPQLLERISPLIGAVPSSGFQLGPRGVFLPRVTPAAILTALTVCSLYVSSLCASGLRALLLSFPFVVVAATMMTIVATETGQRLWSALALGPIFNATTLEQSREFFRKFTVHDAWFVNVTTPYISVAVIAGFAFVLTRFALANHRSAELGSSRVRLQIGWITAYVVAGAAIVGGLPQLLVWALIRW
jgi:hypothetical protein